MAIVNFPGTTAVSAALAGLTDWRDALVALVTWFVENDRCFSSGECTAYLRTYRPDLQFSQFSLGEYLRRWYDNDPDPSYPVPPTFPSYDDGQGGQVYPTQVPRTTSGIARTLDGRTVVTRTPPGITVFVYAKDGVDGYAHDFEVYVPDPSDPQGLNIQLYTGAPIPSPQVTVTPSATPGAAPLVSAPPTPAQSAQIVGRLTTQDLTAYVPNDASGSTTPRVTVPRTAFLAWVNLSGTPIRYGPNGDPVYVTFDGRKVVITRDPAPTSKVYHLTANRGRIAIPNCPGGVSVGEKFRITVAANSLTIDLDDKV